MHNYPRLHFLLILAIFFARGIAQDFEVIKREKIFLTKDADCYAAGDSIIFEGSLTDAATDELLTDYSQYVYVALINPMGDVESRKKVKVINGRFKGYIPIAPNITEGKYTLAAHTLFMQNFPSEYFFKTPVTIAGALTRKYYVDAGISDSVLTARLIDRATEEPVECENLEISCQGKVLASGIKSRRLKWKLNKEIPVVKICFDNYSKFITLPDERPYISLYPEGGRILASIENLVGVKISDNFNRGVSVQGKLEETSGEKVLDFYTDSSGFGSFKFIPKEGRAYQVAIGDKKTLLPEVKDIGAKITLGANQKDAIFAEIVGNIESGALLTVEHNGMVIFRNNASGSPLQFRRNALPEGLISFRLSTPENGVISARYSLNHSAENAKERYALDVKALCIDSDEYDLTRFSGEFPIEIGGELSGFVKTEWRDKPVKNATVNVISPTMGTAYETTTDENGFFVIDGLEWPEETAFACLAKKPNGDILPNLTLTEDKFVHIDPLPSFPEENINPQYFSTASAHPNAIMLREVEVIAKTPEENQAIIFSALGIRSVSEDLIGERNITNYEEALRMFPGIYVQNGKILSRRGSSSIGNSESNVEIWVDGVLWNPSFTESSQPIDMAAEKRPQQTSAMGEAVSRVSNIMTGGLLPSDIATQQYVSMLSTLNELSGSYPFAIVKSIDYVPPQSALFISNSAAHGGGALVITTKSDNGKHPDYHTGIKVFRPLGVQK